MAAPQTLPPDVMECVVGDVRGCRTEWRGMVDDFEAHIIVLSRQATRVLIEGDIDRGAVSSASVAHVLT